MTKEHLKTLFCLSRLPMWWRNKKTAFRGWYRAAQNLREGCPGMSCWRHDVCRSSWLGQGESLWPGILGILWWVRGTGLWCTDAERPSLANGELLSFAGYSDGRDCSADAVLFTPRLPLISLLVRKPLSRRRQLLASPRQEWLKQRGEEFIPLRKRLRLLLVLFWQPERTACSQPNDKFARQKERE